MNTTATTQVTRRNRGRVRLHARDAARNGPSLGLTQFGGPFRGLGRDQSGDARCRDGGTPGVRTAAVDGKARSRCRPGRQGWRRAGDHALGLGANTTPSHGFDRVQRVPSRPTTGDRVSLGGHPRRRPTTAVASRASDIVQASRCGETLTGHAGRAAAYLPRPAPPGITSAAKLAAERWLGGDPIMHDDKLAAERWLGGDPIMHDERTTASPPRTGPRPRLADSGLVSRHRPRVGQAGPASRPHAAGANAPKMASSATLYAPQDKATLRTATIPRTQSRRPAARVRIRDAQTTGVRWARPSHSGRICRGAHCCWLARCLAFGNAVQVEITRWKDQTTRRPVGRCSWLTAIQ